MVLSERDDVNCDIQDECILYELLVYSEWKPDPEYAKLPRLNERTRHPVTNSSLLNILPSFKKRGEEIDEILKLQLNQMPWLFAVGDSGKVVAILQENLLEIRIARDEYSSIVGKAVVARDPFPQWRKLAWSPDCSMLAVAHSTGIISFYDLLGSNIFTIFPSKLPISRGQEIHNPLAAILFLQCRTKSPKWSSELIIVDYHGDLTSYLVSPTDGFQESHSFSFSSYYHKGVFAVAYHPRHNLLFIAGSTGLFTGKELEGCGNSKGLSAWRILNDFPYYKLAMAMEEEDAILQAQRSIWNWLPTIRKPAKKNTIFKMEVSPNGTLLACLHSYGSISIWQLPSIRLKKIWELTEQPGYDVRNPQLLGFSKPKFRSSDSNQDCYPIDTNWWSEQAMIVARLNGAVSVCSVSNLGNLLGESPEFLAGQPRISSMCSERGFLGLECEIQLASRKRTHSDLIDMPSETESSDDEEEASLFNRSSAILQSAVYMITDMERFQPKRKRLKVLHKTYRLLGLKSTTPEELYSRKIDNEEYGDALDLARTYNLDCDLVYQRQWRNSKVSIHTIHDYLSKITKRSWVLKECVQRVPDSFDATQELLEFGLLGTSLETLVLLGEGTDGGHFVLQEDTTFDKEDQLETSNSEYTEKLLSKIDIKNLTKPQRELIHYRRKLLWYLDMLHTYKKIGGERELYNFEFYDRFRSESVLVSTTEFAREGKWFAVKVMFTYHGEVILPYWLPILSNFPETMNPYEYESLLPECDSEGNVFSWKQEKLRPKDWCEEECFLDVLEVQNEMKNQSNFDNDSELSKFICTVNPLTANLLLDWYVNRAHDIEKRSCIVDHALSFVKLGQSRNIAGLEDLCNQLVTLESLVYNVGLINISLQELQNMTDLEKGKLLLSKTTESSIVKDMCDILLPFLLRCEQRSKGSHLQTLRGCLLDISTHSLTIPLTLFEYLRTEQNTQLASWDEIVALGLDCLYSYPHGDELHVCTKILECVADRSFRIKNNAVRERLNEVECDLQAGKILSDNGLLKPLAFIRDCKAHTNSVQQLLIRLSHSVARQVPPPTKMQWDQLLADMLTLRSKVFQCISLQLVYEMYAETLLSSGSAANIRMAADILEVHRADMSHKWVPFDRSIALILQVSQQYFDSASSLVDPAMELAKACLHLINDEDETIQENLDLIASLQLLNDFGLTMLPVHVRQCTERLRLVEACIRKRPLAYRSSNRLLQLAQKLRIASGNTHQREGKVLSLIAETALKEKDYLYCAEVCQRLVESNYSGGWEVVQELGLCTEFHDLKLRHSLLAFTLLHCPANSIETLINARCLLESEMLHKYIISQVDPNAVEEDEFCDALTSPCTSQKEFPIVSTVSDVVTHSTETIKQTTYNMIQNISSKDFWKNSFKWGIANDSSPFEEEEFSPFSQQGLPAFYSSVAPGCHLSSLDPRYDSFVVPDIRDHSLQVCKLLLRTLLLEQTASEEVVDNMNPNILAEIGARLLAEDSALGICHLLQVKDVKKVEEVFKNLPCTSISLQLALYYFAMLGWLNIKERGINHQRDMFLHPPLQLVNHMTDIAVDLDPKPLWAEYLLHYCQLLVDFEHGQQMQACGSGVDLQKFSHDEKYRRESILGLALTVVPEQFELAIKLGTRHKMSVAEIAAVHVNALLVAPVEEISISAVTNRLNDPILLKFLLSEPAVVCERMTEYVYPTLSGLDHQRLLLYYSVLNTLAELFVTNLLTPKDHIKLLKKVKAIHPAIDYKDLVSGTKSILDVIKPVLQHDNVTMIAKLVRGLPEALQDGTEPGAVFSVWSQEIFFQVPDENNIETRTWLDQYKASSKIFNKMDAGDILRFAKGICFSEISYEKMTYECRIQLLKEVEDYCSKHLESVQKDDVRKSWQETTNQLTCWRNHLDKLNMKKMSSNCDNCDDMNELLKKLDLSRGESDKVLHVMQDAVASSVDLLTVEELLLLLPSPTYTLRQLLEKLLDSATLKIRSSPDPESLFLLSSVLRRLQQSVEQKNSQVEPIAATVLNHLELLCADNTLTPKIRLQVLSLLQVSELEGKRLEPEHLLLHFTQAVIALAWPDLHLTINDNDLTTDANRRHIFTTLLSNTFTWDQILTLTQLLERWPPFITVNGRNGLSSPWLLCLQKILNFKEVSVSDIEQTLEDIFKKTFFSEECLLDVIKETENTAWLSPQVLLCLMTESPSVHEMAISLIRKYYKDGAPPLSNRVCLWLLQRGLTSSVVDTSVYSQLVDLVLTQPHIEFNSKKIDAQAVCNQLIQKDCIAEAGTLMLCNMRVPASLNVFSSALFLAHQIAANDKK